MPSAQGPDFYGNHPLFYSVIQNDVEMIKKCFTRGRDYLTLKNYKYRTFLHIAARYNSIDAIKQLLGNQIFFQALIDRDYKGNTALHIAAKHNSKEVFEFLATACTPSVFLI